MPPILGEIKLEQIFGTFEGFPEQKKKCMKFGAIYVSYFMTPRNEDFSIETS